MRNIPREVRRLHANISLSPKPPAVGPLEIDGDVRFGWLLPRLNLVNGADNAAEDGDCPLRSTRHTELSFRRSDLPPLAGCLVQRIIGHAPLEVAVDPDEH